MGWVRANQRLTMRRARSLKINATRQNRGVTPAWWIETPIPFTKPI